jgi:hypothetical protein
MTGAGFFRSTRAISREPYVLRLRSVRTIALFPIVVLLAACAGVILPEPRAPEADGILPGFDTRTYPGDAAMRAWYDASPYHWVGYYLSAPCYTGTTWNGRREEIASMGWGMAVIYVGEQDWSAVQPPDTSVAAPGARCTSENLDAERGRLDAIEADSIMEAEGFAPGTPIFLDVERMERVSRAMETYVRAWFAHVLAVGRYTPALYAHERNATTLYEAARIAFVEAGRSDTPILWVARAEGFTVDSRPADSGILTASIWQGLFDTHETWGGVTLKIDANVASAAVPGLAPLR